MRYDLSKSLIKRFGRLQNKKASEPSGAEATAFISSIFTGYEIVIANGLEAYFCVVGKFIRASF